MYLDGEELQERPVIRKKREAGASVVAGGRVVLGEQIL